MKYLPKNSLAFYQSAPQFHRIDTSSIPASVLATSTSLYRETCGLMQPTKEAVQFYTLNHLVSILKKKFTPYEPLPDWAQMIASCYLGAVSSQGRRMLHYILAICTKEMRHLNVSHVKESFWSNCEATCGPQMVSWLKSVKSGGEEDILKKWFQSPPAVSMGMYMNAMAAAFHQPQGSSKPWAGSYGGKKWGVIADTCVSFLEGNTSLEAMVDTGYTLAHNTSPIFNKGMMYEQYNHGFLTVLDVQRSGQMPELVLDSAFPDFSDSLLEKCIHAVWSQYKQEFRGWVDWFQVESLGAIGKYQQYKDTQVLLHPEKVEKKQNGMRWEQVGVYQVWPGVKVPTYQREKI